MFIWIFFSIYAFNLVHRPTNCEPLFFCPSNDGDKLFTHLSLVRQPFQKKQFLYRNFIDVDDASYFLGASSRS